MPLPLAVLWGILQGVTEFLPVSSSGHLALIPWLLGGPVPGLLFDLVVHGGTLLAILAYFGRDIKGLFVGVWRLVRRRRADTPEGALVWWILVSALPAAVAGALASDLVERTLNAPWMVSAFLAVTGGILYLAERLGRRTRALDSLGWRDALWIGLAQAVALLPGISRSGATISAGLMRGLERQAAARFSFLMALPAIAGALMMEILHALRGGLPPAEGASLWVGFAASALSGYLALRFLFRHIQVRSLRPFAYYCWAIAFVGLAVSLLRGV